MSDATFSVSSTTNPATIDVTNLIAFYGGTVTNNMQSGSKLRFRVDVPPDATRWLSTSIHSNSVRWYLDQGSLPTETTSKGIGGGENEMLGDVAHRSPPRPARSLPGIALTAWF